MEIVLTDPSLVVLCGPAASGKSAFARKHFSGTQVVSSDRRRALLLDDEAVQTASHLAFDLMHSIIDKRLFLRRLTVADSTAPAAEARRTLRKISDARGVPCFLIAFDAPLKELARRDSTRSRKVGHNLLMSHVEKFEGAKERFSREGYAGFWILCPADSPKVSLTGRGPARLQRRAHIPLRRLTFFW